MYPRNNASPEPIAIGAVVQISDGAVQTAGCTVRIKPIGVAEGDGAGTTSYSTDGIVYYTPTQAETNYTSFILIAKKTGCIPVAVTVVTSASSTPGNAGLDWGAVINKTTTNALTGTTIADTQKVDVNTIKTNPVVNAGTVTFPTNSTLASTTNITAGTITTVTTVTNQLTAAQIATGVWQDATAGDFTAANSIGKSIMNGVALGTGLTVARCTLTDTLTTYTGNTPQTGDSYAIVNSGTHGNAAIKGYVDDIGVAGAGLTAIPWNAAWDAEVQSEVDDALVAQRLDELLNADSDIDGAQPPTVGSVFHELMTKTAGSFTYDQATDSLEALRDRGDAAWTTATGFSTHSAADVWAVATRVLTANTNLNDPTAAAIADAVWDEALSGHLTSGSTGEALNAAGAAGDPWTTSLPGAYGAGSAGYIVGTNLNATVSSRSSHSAADVWAVATRTLTSLSGLTVDTVTTVTNGVTVTTNNDKTGYSLTQAFPSNFAALAITVGGAVTAGTVSDKTGYSISGTTTTLDALQNALNSAHGSGSWATATGFSTLDAAGVRNAVGLASANLDTQIGTLATAASLATVAGYLDTEIAAILADTNELQTDWTNGGRLDLIIDAINAKTTNLPAAPAATGDIPSASSIATTLLDLADGIETSVTVRKALRAILSALAGKLSGGATTAIVIRDVNDTVNRISATVDENGNRSAVTLNLN